MAAPFHLIALAAACAQPLQLYEFLAPRTGTYGWLEQLAGSCFEGRVNDASVIRECFSIRDGRLSISSLQTGPASRHRSECVLESASEDGTSLRFDCRENGFRQREMIAHYEEDRLIRDYPSRSRAAPIAPRSRGALRRLDAERLEFTWSTTFAAAREAMIRRRPVILVRTAQAQ